MADSTFTPYTIIQKIANRYLTKNTKEKALDDIKSIEYGKTYLDANLGEFPIETYGNNLIASPNMYLEEKAIKDIKENPKLDYFTGGTTGYTSGIELNPDSTLNPMSVLLHEMEHYKQMFRDYYDNTPREAVNIEELNKKNSDRGKKVKSNFNTYLKGRPIDMIASRMVSGQESSGEMEAQLKAYEAHLPAGMTLFQSPLGKELFKTDEDKLWWLANNTSSMSKFSFENKK